MTGNDMAPSPLSREIARWIVQQRGTGLPAEVADKTRRVLLDVVGLTIAARETDYVASCLAAADETGPCSAFGHPGGHDMYGAALVNGTAAHGEDFDDTFEGGPVHSGAILVPAVLAACERFGVDEQKALTAIAIGIEVQCRLSLVAPTATHKAGFHPTAVFGAFAAAAGVGAALDLDEAELVSALGIAGSMASGIIEYLADGSWTKRMHAGWAAQSGIRAAMMARGGFLGPGSVLEGRHGAYKAFAPSRTPDFTRLLDGLGSHWHLLAIGFKPLACGTMVQPYVDCAIRLRAAGLDPGDVEAIVCEVGEGTVHRLWEPLAEKHAPATAYLAKFSAPYCIAVGLADGAAGLQQFTEARVMDPTLRALAGRVSYVVDPANPYPQRFTGHLRVTLRDGREVEVRQENMRGGAHDPLPFAEIEQKFFSNARFGGWNDDPARRLAAACTSFGATGRVVDFTPFRK